MIHGLAESMTDVARLQLAIVWLQCWLSKSKRSWILSKWYVNYDEFHLMAHWYLAGNGSPYWIQGQHTLFLNSLLPSLDVGSTPLLLHSPVWQTWRRYFEQADSHIKSFGVDSTHITTIECLRMIMTLRNSQLLIRHALHTLYYYHNGGFMSCIIARNQMGPALRSCITFTSSIIGRKKAHWHTSFL